MSNSAVLTTGAHEVSEGSEIALASTLFELLTAAHAKLEVDRKAAQIDLSSATRLLAARLGQNVEPKIAHAFRGGLQRWQANRLEAYIEQNLEQSIRSADLIALTGMSPGHFFRAFKTTFGQAPFAYIARRRVRRAQQMLLTTKHSLSQIALDCGMCDQSHLTRLFRKTVGMTPGEWRRIQIHTSLGPTAAPTAFA